MYRLLLLLLLLGRGDQSIDHGSALRYIMDQKKLNTYAFYIARTVPASAICHSLVPILRIITEVLHEKRLRWSSG